MKVLYHDAGGFTRCATEIGRDDRGSLIASGERVPEERVYARAETLAKATVLHLRHRSAPCGLCAQDDPFWGELGRPPSRPPPAPEAQS